MKTLFMMRYSYFGTSGWRSKASKDPGKLFSAERLKMRFELLRDIALPSLADQDDQDFKLAILSSKGMPKWRKRQLVRLAYDTLGEDRVDILFKPPSSAANMFQNYLRARYARDELVTQVVLDDDDAVSRDFVGLVKREAQAAYDLRLPGKPFCFLSFPKGLSLELSDTGASLYNRTMPFTNLGLSMVGPAGAKRNIYRIAHKNVARYNPARAIYTQQPVYVRTLHGMNDSRALRSENALDSTKMPTAVDAFPFLKKFFPKPGFHEQPQQLAA